MFNNNNDIDIDKKAINEYVKSWRDQHPSILKIREKEEEFNMLKSQYDDAYKTYIQNVKKGSDSNYPEISGHNVSGIEEEIEKNKIRYIRVEHNYQYIHINEMQVYDEFNNNVAENSVVRRMKVSITTGSGRWDSTRRLHSIWFNDGNRTVTKRYYLNGKYIQRDQTTTFEIPVNFSTSSINGMSYYVGNDGTVIKKIKLEIWNENTNRWDIVIDKTERGRGKWVKNAYNKINFRKISIPRNTSGPEAYASSEGWSGDANKIIDGNHEAVSWWPGGNSNHTLNRQNEYVELDLKKSHNIKRVRIWNRPDCCRWRLWNSKMKFFNESRQQVGDTISLSSRRVRDYYPDIDNQPKEGKISKAFKKWIGLKECHQLCAEDEDCGLALYRPQTYITGKGWTWGNQCIHYDKSVGDSQQIDLPDYQYVAYNKPIWENEKNMNIGKGQLTMEEDNDFFKFLGKHDTLASCQSKSVNSDKGPYDGIVYYSNKYKDKKWREHCYGSIMGSMKNKQKDEGVYTSIPPGGQTGVITEEHLNSLEEVIYLNKKLSKLGDEIAELHMKIYKTGEDYDNNLKKINFSLDNKKLKELQHLEKDRKKLLKIKKDIQGLNEQEENYEYILTSNYYTYIFLAVVTLALIGITARQINKY